MFLRGLIVLAVLGTAHKARCGSVIDIPLSNRATLRENWAPTPEQARRALVKIDQYLRQLQPRDAWQRRQIRGIFSHIRTYRVQFIGVRSNKRDVIYCNFFTIDSAERRDIERTWRKQEVAVDDGDFYFWHIVYDPTSDECFAFYANDVA